MARPLKENAADFAAALRRRGRHKPPFHWTPLSNLPGVLQHGILSRNHLEKLGLPFIKHGYGTAGKEAQFGGYVCISFQPQKGMMRRENEPQALLEVRPELIYVAGAFYCPGNSAKNEYQFDELVQKTALPDLDELFEGPDEWRLKDWQAEVWVPGYIATGDIVRVLFANDRIRDRAIELCKGIPLGKDLEFAIGANWHFPTPAEPEPEPVEDEQGYELEEDFFDDEDYEPDDDDRFDAIMRQPYMNDAKGEPL